MFYDNTETMVELDRSSKVCLLPRVENRDVLIWLDDIDGRLWQ